MRLTDNNYEISNIGLYCFIVRIIKMRTIQYGIDTETGLIWSRVGSEVAIPILNYDGMRAENNYCMSYFLEKMSVLQALPTINYIKWTRKISTEIKNIHRAFWGMKLLKG